MPRDGPLLAAPPSTAGNRDPSVWWLIRTIYLIGVCFMGVPHERAPHCVYLTGVYVMGMHLIDMHLIGVYSTSWACMLCAYLIGVHFMGVHHRMHPFLLSRIRNCCFWWSLGWCRISHFGAGGNLAPCLPGPPHGFLPWALHTLNTINLAIRMGRANGLLAKTTIFPGPGALAGSHTIKLHFPSRIPYPWVTVGSSPAAEEAGGSLS